MGTCEVEFGVAAHLVTVTTGSGHLATPATAVAPPRTEAHPPTSMPSPGRLPPLATAGSDVLELAGEGPATPSRRGRSPRRPRGGSAGPRRRRRERAHRVHARRRGGRDELDLVRQRGRHGR